jgi:hypothetical protein
MLCCGRSLPGLAALLPALPLEAGPGRRLLQAERLPGAAGALHAAVCCRYEAHSYGYRGDTGRKHHPALPARGEEYGPAFGPGDVVGAGMHLPRHEIFFT